MNAPAAVPTTSEDFNRAYRFPFTIWGDVRIPPEIKALIQPGVEQSALELGCGVGRFAQYLAQNEVAVTGVDFSSVAIGKARMRVANDELQPTFLVGDVTHLDEVSGPFDFSYDVGCFHCLGIAAQQAYLKEVHRLLRPAATHLIWAMDTSPSDLPFSPKFMETVCSEYFWLTNAKENRRRIVASHWYWLQRKG